MPFLHKAGPFKNRLMDTPEGSPVQHVTRKPVDNAMHFMGKQGIQMAKQTGSWLHPSGYVFHHDQKLDKPYLNADWKDHHRVPGLTVDTDPETGIQSRVYLHKNKTENIHKLIHEDPFLNQKHDA